LVLISSYPNSLDGLRSNFQGKAAINNIKIVFKDFKNSFLDKSIRNSIVNLSIHTGYYRALKDYLQPVLQVLVLSVPWFLWYDEKQRIAIVVGLVYFLIYIMTSFASRWSGGFKSLFQHFAKPLNITLAASLIIGFMSGLFYSFDLIVISVSLYIGIFIIENLRKPIGIAKVADRANKDILATVLSAESQFHSLIAAIFAPIIGFVADYAGLGKAVLVVSAILLILFPMFRLKKEKLV